MGKSSPKPAPPPARRPERTVDVEPEDVLLGDKDLDTEEGTDVKRQGKRSLVKPSGGSTATGVKV